MVHTDSHRLNRSVLNTMFSSNHRRAVEASVAAGDIYLFSSGTTQRCNVSFSQRVDTAKCPDVLYLYTFITADVRVSIHQNMFDSNIRKGTSTGCRLYLMIFLSKLFILDSVVV